MKIILSFLLVIILFSIVISHNLENISAQENQVVSKSVSFENTTLIKFTNQGDLELKSLRLWLTDFTLISFKSENGWTAKQLPLERIIFTAIEPIKPGETVKFGIKTDKPKPDIHWKAIDIEGNQIDAGKTLAESIQTLIEKKPDLPKYSPGILSESNFRIIPENPRVGSTVRVTGENFVPNSILELFLNNIKLNSFETDENGDFMLTMIIPEKQQAGKVDFIIKDKLESNRTLGLNLLDPEKITKIKDLGLTISEIPNTFYIGEVFVFSGTAQPYSAIIMNTKNSKGDLLSTKATNADSKGQWSTSFIIFPDIELGSYTTEITDNKDTIIKNWNVVLAKTIHLSPTKIIFKSGEAMKFNGTAIPKEPIEMILDDPHGNEVSSKNFIVRPSGLVEIEFPTERSSPEGTYVLFASQGNETEIVLTGLNEFSKNNLSSKMLKINYNPGDQAKISLTGIASETADILILDERNRAITDTVIIGSDGTRNYIFDLTGFSPGVYTVAISMGSFQTTELFSIGLQSSISPIHLEVIKKVYSPGEPISAFIQSNPHVIIDLFLIDSDDNVAIKRELFTNREGYLALGNIVIPYDAITGEWILRAESGLNFVNIKLQILPSEQKPISISISDIFSSQIGKFVTLEGFGSPDHKMQITIEDPENQIIWQTQIITTKDGEFSLLWSVPPDVISGTYSVKIEDEKEQIDTTSFTL